MSVVKHDLIGKRFGMLTAIKYVGLRSYKPMRTYRKSFWLFQCDCGKLKEVDRGSVLKGSVKSCGCRGKKNWESNFCSLYHNRRKVAIKHGREWTLTKEQFLQLTSQNCFYCGRKPSSIQITKRCVGQYIYNGVDRVDNEIGYVFENCVTCCEHCNRAKLYYHVDDFKSWVVSVYNHWACK